MIHGHIPPTNLLRSPHVVPTEASTALLPVAVGRIAREHDGSGTIRENLGRSIAKTRRWLSFLSVDFEWTLAALAEVTLPTNRL